MKLTTQLVIIDSSSLKLDPLSFDHKLDRLWIAQYFHDWLWQVCLVSPMLMMRNTNLKFCSINLPLGQYIIRLIFCLLMDL